MLSHLSLIIQINCSLTDNEGPFVLQPLYDTNEFQIETSGTSKLDRERQARYTLTVVCSDNGPIPYTVSRRLTINIGDINDHTPIFTRTVYEATVFERNYRGMGLLQVSATDADAGPNAAIEYRLQESASEWFDVHPVTGQIETLVEFDREQTDKVEFVVYAEDQGTPVRTGTATVRVTIVDINDETPAFDSSHYVFDVQENLPPGIVVHDVTATDKDGPAYNEFTISFHPSYTGQDAFKLDPKTGRLTTARPLDREEQAQYRMVIIAVDQDMEERTGSTTVIVNVGDDNDNDPAFIFPTQVNNTALLPNSLPVGRVVVQVTARDRDAGDNALVTYVLRGGESVSDSGVGGRRFVIDRHTGEVTVARPLTDITYESFALVVEAWDSGKPARRTNASLLLIVNASIAYATGSSSDGQVRGGGASMFAEVSVTTALVAGAILGCLLLCCIFLIIAVVACQRERARRLRKFEAVRSADSKVTDSDVMITSSSLGGVPSLGSPGHNNMAAAVWQSAGQQQAGNGSSNGVMVTSNGCGGSGRTILRGISSNGSSSRQRLTNDLTEMEPLRPRCHLSLHSTDSCLLTADHQVRIILLICLQHINKITCALYTKTVSVLNRIINI